MTGRRVRRRAREEVTRQRCCRPIRTYGADDGHNVVGVSTNKTTVLSKDGKLTITGSPRITRKKGQRQRPRAERTIRPLKLQFNFCLSAVNRTFYAVFRNVCI